MINIVQHLFYKLFGGKNQIYFTLKKTKWEKKQQQQQRSASSSFL
jgi:hypothetical protein